MHLAKHTKPTTLNGVRELSKMGAHPTKAHMKTMYRVLKHCVDTRHEGLVLKPNARWDGKDRDFLFEITGRSDSDFAKDPETRRSVSGWSAFLNGAPYVRKSKMQRFVTLSEKLKSSLRSSPSPNLKLSISKSFPISSCNRSLSSFLRLSSSNLPNSNPP